MQVPTKKEIESFIDAGYIRKQHHPEDSDIVIYNYTQKCQIDRLWNDVTLQCRGLIMNTKTGEVMARPFPKFFNIGEHKGSIPDEDPVVYEKYDGSLGILYWFNGQPRVATRGSFTSYQALWASEWVKNKTYKCLSGVTYLFEIIYPENRVVVDYKGYEGLVFLGAIDNETGRRVEAGSPFTESPPAKVYSHLDLDSIVSLDSEYGEGFVVHYPESDLRLKYKYPEYVKMHRVVTNITAKSVWQILKDGGDIDNLMQICPDELFTWVRNVRNKLYSNYDRIYHTAENIVSKVEGKERKKQAKMIMKLAPRDTRSVCFALLDGKDTRPIIWDILKPDHETPYSKALKKIDY